MIYFTLRDGGFEELMTLPATRIVHKEAVAIDKLYTSHAGQIPLMELALETGQVENFVNHSQGVIDINASLAIGGVSKTKLPEIEAEIILPRPELAVYALYHHKWQLVDRSPKFTGNVDLSTELGKLCTYYSIVMNDEAQLKAFFHSHKVTGQIDINEVVGMPGGQRGPLVNFAQFHNVLGEFLGAAISSEKSTGTFDLGNPYFDGTMMIEGLQPELRETVLRYSAAGRLHITCTTDQVKIVESKLTEFGFGDAYFKMQFIKEDNVVLNTAMSGSQEGGFVYAVKANTIFDATSKIATHLLGHGKIFCFLEPVLEPEKVTVDSLVESGMALDAAQALLGDFTAHSEYNQAA